MKKKSKYGRNPKLNPKTHCVMVRFDDVEWNRFLTMYEESQVYAKAVFLKAHFFGQKFRVHKVDKAMLVNAARCSSVIIPFSSPQTTLPQWEHRHNPSHRDNATDNCKQPGLFKHGSLVITSALHHIRNRSRGHRSHERGQTRRLDQDH